MRGSDAEPGIQRSGRGAGMRTDCARLGEQATDALGNPPHRAQPSKSPVVGLQGRKGWGQGSPLGVHGRPVRKPVEVWRQMLCSLFYRCEN